jgi:hypothetical protein
MEPVLSIAAGVNAEKDDDGSLMLQPATPNRTQVTNIQRTAQ